MSSPSVPPLVLGSQSLQRRELLGKLLGAHPWSVVPPSDSNEPGFSAEASLAAIDAQLLRISRLKYDDVHRQLAGESGDRMVLAADTCIVGLPDDAPPVVLGKPPETPDRLRVTLHEWFGRFYAGRMHLAKTAVCVGRPGHRPHATVVTTEVWFRADAVDLVDWYIGTGEPRGKAGGYAIQELGSLFVERLTGSLSNVVGLPLLETLGLIRQAAETTI